MRILITGGAGFIGSHTCERFVRNGHRVRVADNLSSGSLSNIEAVAGDIEFAEVDIRDFNKTSEACQGMEMVLHLAAVSSVVKSIEDPLATERINTAGTINVIEACRRQGVSRLVMASSAAVYGEPFQLPLSEDSQTRPGSPYAWQKQSGEFYGSFFSRQGGAGFLALRYFNVYGPRQDPASPYSGVISIFVRQARLNQPLAIYGDGSQTRDFIHVSDIAEANLRAVEAAGPLPPVINVGTGKETSITEAAAIIQKSTNSNAPIIKKQKREGDIYRSFSTTTRLKDVLDFTPAIAIETGLLDLLNED